jgi:hypothetical protein
VKSALGVAAIFLLGAVQAFAAMDGTVVNKSTGQPQPGVAVTLVKPGQGGMKTLGTTISDASGHFAFAKDEPGGGPQLLQASYGDVNYNKLMTPNIATSKVELDVYDVVKTPELAHIAQRMLILEPSASQISVNETTVVQNGSNRTYNNPALGGLRFYLPPAANGQVRISVQGPGGMPLPRTAEKTNETDVFKVDFPVKPGETEFQVSYVLPAGSPFTFHGESVTVKGMGSGPLRVIAPSGVTLAGKDLEQLGTEPTTQATVYNVASNGLFSFDITGTGSLRSEGEGVDTSDSPQVTEGKPPIYAHLYWLIGLALSILAVGLVVLFRSSPVAVSSGR